LGYSLSILHQLVGFSDLLMDSPVTGHDMVRSNLIGL
jgi:hypothetical protein